MGVIICPTGKSMIFFKKEKNWVSGQTCFISLISKVVAASRPCEVLSLAGTVAVVSLTAWEQRQVLLLGNNWFRFCSFKFWSDWLSTVGSRGVPFWNNKNKHLFNKIEIKVWVRLSWRFSGTSAPSRQHTWQCPWFSVVPEAVHEASPGPLKGAMSAKKAIQWFETESRELLGGRNGRAECFPVVIFYLLTLP